MPGRMKFYLLVKEGLDLGIALIEPVLVLTGGRAEGFSTKEKKKKERG